MRGDSQNSRAYALGYQSTFNKPFGRFTFPLMSFDIGSTQNELQCKIDEIYEGLHGVTAFVDDFHVYGKMREEYDENICEVLTRLREKGLEATQINSQLGSQKFLIVDTFCPQIV